MIKQLAGKIVIEVTAGGEIIIESDYTPLGTMLILNEATKGNGIKLAEDLIDLEDPE